MDKKSKIYVAGHRGLVGSAIIRALQKQGYENIIFKTRQELDLLNSKAVAIFFEQEKPEYVFDAAAKVGGILANNTYPADFIHQNLVIQNNIIHNSYIHGVKKLLFLGSTCVYPRTCPQPTKEDYLLTGELEPTNAPYAAAKIAGIMMCNSYNRQHGTDFISVMPTNAYGPNDHYDLETSHVAPALLRKFYEAKLRGDREVVLWGTGSAIREFLSADDLAEACVFLMNTDYKDYFLINIGTGVETSIKELAELIKEISGFRGKLIWDTSKPDGAPRRVLDVSRIHSLGWRHKTNLKEGLRVAYDWLAANYEKIKK